MINSYFKGGKLIPHCLYHFLSLIPVLGRVFADHPLDCRAFFIAVKLSGSAENDDAGILDGETVYFADSSGKIISCANKVGGIYNESSLSERFLY